MLGTASGLWILVKNHMCQECTNVKFEALTPYSDGDINQNRVKISIFTLGKESCMKLRVKAATCTLPFFQRSIGSTNKTS